MSSFINIELDTSGPIIEECSIPQYIGYGDNTHIEIITNEELSINHEISVIDSNGNEKKLTFQLENDKLSGLLDVSGLVGGMTEIIITLFDEVMNPSKILKKNFIIFSTDSIAKSEIIIDQTSFKHINAESIVENNFVKNDIQNINTEIVTEVMVSNSHVGMEVY